MSLVHKFIFALIAVMCFVQFVEMSRIRRDEAAVEKPGAPSVDLKGTIDSMVEKLKELVDEDKLKEILVKASDALAEGAKKLKEQIN